MQNSRWKSRREAGRNGPEIIGDGILSVNIAYQVLKAAVSDETIDGVSSATHICLMSSASKQRRLNLNGAGEKTNVTFSVEKKNQLKNRIQYSKS